MPHPASIACPTCKRIAPCFMTVEGQKKYEEGLDTLRNSSCDLVCPECQQLVFRIRPCRAVAFLWPIPLPNTFIPGGVIMRTEAAIDVEDELCGRTDYALVLGVGPGWWDNKKFNPTDPDLCWPGTMVQYDKSVPWRIRLPGVASKSEVMVVMCGAGDIKGIIEA